MDPINLCCGLRQRPFCSRRQPELIRDPLCRIKEIVGQITRTSLQEIAQTKMKDLNAVDIEGAMRQIEGTARQMGIKIID